MLSRISCCLTEHAVTAVSLHSFAAFGSLRKSPSPLQGASTTMTSNNSPALPKSDESFCVTIEFANPHLAMFCCKTLFLDEITSLLTSKPEPFIKDNKCVDFPPGAAQRSKTIGSSFSFMACKKSCSRNCDPAS